MAQIRLGATDTNFKITNNKSSIYGANGSTNDRVLINAGVTDTMLASTIEKADFAGDISSYQFKKGFLNNFEVYDASGLKIASWTADTGKTLVFANGSVDLSYNSGAISIGGVSMQTTMGKIVGAQMGSETSLVTAGNGTVAISSAGTTSATTANDVFNIASTSSYTHDISGFDLANDKLNFGADVTIDSISTENSALDGMVSLSYTNGANTVKITLVGLTQAQEGSLATNADFAALLV